MKKLQVFAARKSEQALGLSFGSLQSSARAWALGLIIKTTSSHGRMDLPELKMKAAVEALVSLT